MTWPSISPHMYWNAFHRLDCHWVSFPVFRTLRTDPSPNPNWTMLPPCFDPYEYHWDGLIRSHAAAIDPRPAHVGVSVRWPFSGPPRYSPKNAVFDVPSWMLATDSTESA